MVRRPITLITFPSTYSMDSPFKPVKGHAQSDSMEIPHPHKVEEPLDHHSSGEEEAPDGRVPRKRVKGEQNGEGQ